MNIVIVRAFIAMRKLVMQCDHGLPGQLHQLKERVGAHDVQLAQIYDSIENLLDEKVTRQSWGNRQPIGFARS